RVARLSGELLGEFPPFALLDRVSVIRAAVEIRGAEREVELLSGVALFVLQFSGHAIRGADLEFAGNVRERPRLSILTIGDQQRMVAAGCIVAERQSAAPHSAPTFLVFDEASV